MKAVVLGAGRMGSAICLAMRELKSEVLVLDVSQEALDAAQKLVPETKTATVENVENIFKRLEGENGIDVVISSLPYHQNKEVGIWCIDNGLRYCDLGGRVDVSKEINNHAKSISPASAKPVFTDLGLAPGWVNILAEQGYQEMDCESIDSVQMMVGGIPGVASSPPLNYLNTWSIEGLINEYKDNCEVLVGSNIMVVQGLEGLETVRSHIIEEELEAFYTSGGASHTIASMKERGVKDCSYKTLRYKGHAEFVKFLMRTCKLSDEVLADIFTKASNSNMPGDIVVVKAIVKSGPLTWEREYMVPHDDTFSAMQMATAFPISSVAALMGDGDLDHLSSATYADVPIQKFNDNLNKLGDFGRYRYPFF